MTQASAPPYDPAWNSIPTNDLSDVELDDDEIDVDIIPDISELRGPPGYETLGFTDSSVPPPYSPPLQTDNSQHQFADIIYLSEDDARDSLLGYVTEHCCYGKRAAREMNINNILPSNALHYTLVSFTEDRSTKHASKPYWAGRVDGPENGTPPGPWDISCQPRAVFNEEVRLIEVPHTDSVKRCHRCGGAGKIRCMSCRSSGKVKCYSCSGRGRHTYRSNNATHTRTCSVCHGTGRIKCIPCSGSGWVRCDTCSGARRLKWFVQLTVKFKNITDDHVIEHTDFPNDKVKNVEGTTIFDETQDNVHPITSHPDEELNNMSRHIVTNHQTTTQDSMQKILKQRHTVRAVPISEVHWTWQTSGSRFWVYGQERKVHVPKYAKKYCCGCFELDMKAYPQKCCRGCVIL
ncbi:protein SSUH2 homolog isoform X2 [Ptychodera flava]|uniref:protein SSUH2 homolog isoform X2 n=1 Tax=Ptychodera flava TaxID=63121 RepID=UPI003969CF1D